MTRALFCTLSCLALAGCFSSNETRVIVPQPAAGAYEPAAGCVDGFGAIQSGTSICVGASG
ncbi:hypothetical protein [Gymnodinialimonas sp.]